MDGKILAAARAGCKCCVIFLWFLKGHSTSGVQPKPVVTGQHDIRTHNLQRMAAERPALLPTEPLPTPMLYVAKNMFPKNKISMTVKVCRYETIMKHCMYNIIQSHLPAHCV